MKYALVTGATGVLGTAFCKNLAGLGYNLFVTGRRAEKLSALKNALVAAYPGVNVDFCAADLTDEEERESLFSAASAYKFSVAVNVAGADIQKPLGEYTQKKLVFQTRVCFEAAAAVCLFAKKNKAETLHIINISSLCGEQPMPYFALYSACKGALTDFSVALSREFKGEGITSTAVVAGSILTRPDVKEYINSLGFWARKSAKTPEYVATKSLKAAFKGKRKIVPGGLNKVIYFFSKLLPPRLKLNIAARTRRGVSKDVF